MSEATPNKAQPPAKNNKPLKVDDELMKKIPYIVTVPAYERQHVLKKLASFVEKVDAKDIKTQSKQYKQMEDEFNAVVKDNIRTFGLENHYVAAMANDSKFGALAVSMTKDLIQEYGCTKKSEVGLVHLIVTSYVRYLDLSERHQTVTEMEYLSHEKINYYRAMAQEMDRAHRQYLSGLNALTALKQPPMKVNVRTNNAFVAQNQQVNAAPAPAQGVKNDAGQ